MPDIPVPADVPEAMVVTDKDGTKHDANGRGLYVMGYRSGWKDCVLYVQKGWFDPADEKADRPVPGHYGIVVDGWEAGFEACRLAILARRKKSTQS